MERMLIRLGDTNLENPLSLEDHIPRRRTPNRLHTGWGRKRTLAAVIVLTIWVLAGPLATIYGDGAQAHQTEEEQIEPPLPLRPEQVRFDHLTTEDGLSENRVWGITQDRRGFLWFTTYDGINRYDGHEFKVYKHDPENPNGPGSTLYRRVLEDSRGMLWFGSLGQGLSRFDPETEQWTNFRHDPQDPNSLGGDAIWAIAEDPQGDLWIGTEANGLNRFDYETGQFTRYRHDPDDLNSLSGNQAQAVKVDRLGAVWVGTQFDGLNRFDPETGQWTHYRHNPADPHGLGGDGIFSLYVDKSGVLWIGISGRGLDRFDPETGQWTHYRHNPADPHGLGGDGIFSLYVDKSGVLWIGISGGGLDRFDANAPGEGTFTHYRHDPEDPASLSDDHVASIYQDRSGTLWVGTFGGGLNQLVPGGAEGSGPEMAGKPHVAIVRYQHDLTDPQSLSHDMAVSIFEDREGLLWVGTGGGGVNKLDLQPKQFALYQHEPGNPNSLAANDVRALYEDRFGDLWVGTYGGGLDRIERTAGAGEPIRVTHYQHDPTDPGSLSSNSVVAIAEARDGSLWIGTPGAGFCRFDRETGTFVRYEADPASPDFRPRTIRVIHKARSGALWFGSFGKGLGRLDPETGQFRVYVYDAQDPRSLSGNSILAIYQDRAGDLWIGTLANGLNRFDRDSESFVHYKNEPQDPGSLSSDMVVAIHQDQSGSLWIGTGGGGLNRFDPQTETFTRFTENDGLPSNTVMGILSDDAGSLWISTAGGVSRFDPQRGVFRNYTASDGLQGDQFTEGVAYKGQDGELFFGGSNGITAFFPEQIRDDESPPPVVLTALRLNYLPVGVGPDSVLKRGIAFADEIRLSQADRVLSFDFASLSYRAPEKNRCRYMLEGFDPDWTEVDSESCSATYTNLDPGEYLFRVTGSNGDGVWNKEGDSIAIIVPAPWWRTWWFLGGLGLVLLVLTVGAYRWRLWNLERRAHELETQVAQRTQALEASERRYRDLVENISDVIYAANVDGTITYVSRAVEALLGYSPAEVIGQHFSRFIDPRDLAQVADRFQQYAGGESLPPRESRMIASSGEVRWTRITSAPIFEGDQVVGVRGVLADVTAGRQMQEQREQVAAAAERQRLARDLHDSVTQTLYSIAATAEALPRVWERQPEVGRQGLLDLGRLAGGALAEMRTLLLQLRPDAIAEQPLDELLRQLVRAAEARSQVPVNLTLTGDCSFQADVQGALYHIAREGLNNALKHAHASRIKLGLYCQRERVTLGIRDNGRGFNRANVSSGRFGLSNMRERAEGIGAEFSLETEPGGGTEITVVWIDPEGELDADVGGDHE
jgi:PAS domain S-box-containing protein